MDASGGQGVRWLGLTVAGLAVVALGAGYAWKDVCSHRPWDGPGPDDVDWQYRAYCYSDILPLWYPGVMEVDGNDVASHDLQHDKIQYLETFNEYPVLTGYFMTGIAAVTTGLLPYIQVTFVLLSLAGALATFALWRLRMTPARTIAWVAAPPLVIHGLTNWDLLAVALAACGWWAWRSGRPFGAAVLLGLGGAAKLYPAFFLPFLFFAAWQTGGRRATAPIVLGGFLGLGLPNLITAAFAWDNWKGMWMFQARRAPDFETPWASAVRPFADWLGLGWDSEEGWMLAAGWIGAIAMLGCLIWLGRRVWRHGLDPLVGGGVTTLVFLLVNKVYSPQYTLWAFPILLLFGARWLPMCLFIAADAANFFVRYQLISNGPSGWHTDEWENWSRLAVGLRWIFLAWATCSILVRHGLVTNPWARRAATSQQRPQPSITEPKLPERRET